MYPVYHNQHSLKYHQKKEGSPIQWVLFLATMCVMFASILNTCEVLVSMVVIKHNLGLNLVEMGWISIVYFTAATALTAIGGQYGDLYGHIRCFLWGCLVYLAGIVVMSVCTGMATLVVGRALQGFGMAFLVANSLSITRMCAPPQYAPLLTRIWISVLFFAYTLGLILGALMSLASWRLNYWTLFPLLLPSMWVIFLHRHNRLDVHRYHKPDIVGSLLLLIAVVLLVLLFTTPPLFGWVSAPVISFIVLAPAAFVLFALYEARARMPIVDLAFFKNALFSSGITQIFLAIFSLFLFLFFGIFYCQTPIGLHATLVESGAYLLPPMAIVVLGCVFAQNLLRHFERHSLLLLGWLIFLGGMLTMVFIPNNVSYAHLWWRFCIVGMGFALIYPNVVPFTLTALPLDKAGEESGIILTFQVFGAVIGIALGQVGYVAAFQSVMAPGFLQAGLGHRARFRLIDAAHNQLSSLNQALSSYTPDVQLLLRRHLHDAALAGYEHANLLGVITAALGCILMLVQCIRIRYGAR